MPGRESILLSMQIHVCSFAGVFRVGTIIMGIITIGVESASFGATGPSEVKQYAKAMDIYFLVIASLCVVISIGILSVSILVLMKDCMKISDLMYSLVASFALFAAAVMLFSLVSTIRSGPEMYKNGTSEGNSTAANATATNSTTPKAPAKLTPGEERQANLKNIAAWFTMVNSLMYLAIAVGECMCPNF